MSQKDCPIGFIGCGNMAQAIVRALGDNGFTKLAVCDVDSNQTQKVETIAHVAASNQSLIDQSQYVFLCVKPYAAEDALQGLNFSDKILVSIMAGTPIARIKTLTGATKVVRVMPNLNAMVRLSYNAYVCDGLSEGEEAQVQEILSVFGLAAQTSEDMLNAVTGIAGGGPAYVFRFFQGLLSEAQHYGFTPSEAIEMCGMVIAGSVGSVLHSIFSQKPDSFDDALKRLDREVDAVCSKKGTTIEGIGYLDEKGFTKIVADAVGRAVRRAEELSK